ncbi:MFS transporter [Rhodanobacter sp. Si-c]|uniref:MFS transporter n=1 Tax=Rhodanobacter lycopersici TaxID=3162487 RepID=A0ABV3QL13_9GAMM
MPIQAVRNLLGNAAGSRSLSVSPEWKVLGGFGVIMMLSGGALWASTLGIFLAPLERDLGWSQTQIYLGVTICYLTTPVFALLVGWLLDRGHARRIIIGAVLMEALVFLGMSRMGHGIGIYYALCILMFGTVLGVTPVPLTKVINSWFVDKRGMALGVLFSLNYAGAMVAPLAALSMIGQLGWRHTYAAFGALVLILAMGAALLWVRVNPEQTLPVAEIVPHKPVAGQRRALLEAIRQKEFLIVAVWLVLYGYSFNSISFHLVPMLEEYGLSAAKAAVAQGLVGLGGLSGNLLAGVLLDRIRASRLATLFALFPLAGIVMLALWPSQASGYVMAVSLGLAVGSEGTILMYLGGRLFAPAILGTVMALLVIVVTIGAASGPAVAALLHDHFGSYHQLLALNALTFLVSALMPFGLKAYRY